MFNPIHPADTASRVMLPDEGEPVEYVYFLADEDGEPLTTEDDEPLLA